ncbi:MAG TPA: hypothetical protein VK465_05555, partial [Fibrobacteria bacterium]|nr:hypothetical protein [Fibrobacteria bacterium]
MASRTRLPAARPPALLPALLAGLAVLSGCYSFSGSTLPAHLRTIHIPQAQNRTLKPELADRVTRGLEEGFRNRT